MIYLRVIFTILCAVCIAALIPLGMAFGWQGVGYCFFGALLFFVLMIFCKQSQEIKAIREQNAKSSETAQTEKESTAENKSEDNQEK